MRKWKVLLIWSVSLSLICGLSTTALALPIVEYHFLPGSSFAEGCVAPCMCPVMISGDVQGSFGLVQKASVTPDVKIYSLSDIYMTVYNSNGDPIHTITGEGTYRFRAVGTGSEKHRLTLKISIDGQVPVLLDSGQVVGCSQFPAFSISVRRGTRCFDIWMDVIAAPVTARP